MFNAYRIRWKYLHNAEGTWKSARLGHGLGGEARSQTLRARSTVNYGSVEAGLVFLGLCGRNADLAPKKGRRREEGWVGWPRAGGADTA